MNLDRGGKFENEASGDKQCTEATRSVVTLLAIITTQLAIWQLQRVLELLSRVEMDVLICR
jgi:cytochrome oxidase assembly protein ShyY1